MERQVDSTNDRLAYIISRIDDRISRLHSSVSWYRGRHYATTLSTVVLSGLITVIAGWKPEIGGWSNNAILALGVVSTIVSAWGAFFAPRDSWLLCAATLGRLRNLQAKIEFERRPPDSKATQGDAIESFFQEYQQILDQHQRSWLEVRSSASKAMNSNAASAPR